MADEKKTAGLPPVISLESFKKDYPSASEETFYAIGVAGGFGDFRNGKHPDPTFALAGLTGEHKAAVEKIFAGLK